MSFQWNGCLAHCKHWGICMESGKHDIHHTGTHPFSDEESLPWKLDLSALVNPCNADTETRNYQ